MQFYAHKTIAAGTLIGLGVHPLGVVAALLGSVLPDLIDKQISLGIKQLYSQIHRRFFHWWVSYTVIAIVSYRYIEVSRYAYFFYYMMIGSLIHIICDSFTKSGVPFLNPFESGYGPRLIYSGAIIEYIVGTVFLGVGLYVRL